jgi:hypothetical protein
MFHNNASVLSSFLNTSTPSGAFSIGKLSLISKHSYCIDSAGALEGVDIAVSKAISVGVVMDVGKGADGVASIPSGGVELAKHPIKKQDARK